MVRSVSSTSSLVALALLALASFADGAFILVAVALPCVGLGASGPAFRSVLAARRASLAGAGAGTGRGEGHRAAAELAGWLGALVATGPLSNEACERFG